MEPQFETGIIAVVPSNLRYRVQKSRASDGVWHQRHVWHEDQLGIHDPPIYEKWIVSNGPPEYHYRPITKKDKP